MKNETDSATSQTVANFSSIKNIIFRINVFLLFTHNLQLLHRTNESPTGPQILLFEEESSDGVRDFANAKTGPPGT